MSQSATLGTLSFHNVKSLLFDYDGVCAVQRATGGGPRERVGAAVQRGKERSLWIQTALFKSWLSAFLEVI